MAGSSELAAPVARTGVRDPDRWLEGAAWLVVLFSALQVLLLAYGRDQGIYAVVGEGILDGQMPYRDLWDFKSPGIYFVYALAQLVFGKAMVSIRLVEIAGLCGVVVAFGALGRELFGSRAAGTLGGALSALIYAQLEFWHTGQPESFGGMLTVFALVATARLRRRVSEDARTPRLLAWAAIGVLFGAAFLLKPPLGGGAVVCAVYLARAEWDARRDARRAVLAVVGIGLASLVPVGLCAAWFWGRGAWEELSWALFEFTPGYTALGWGADPLPMFYYVLQETFVGYSAVVPAGVLAAIVLRPIYSREREGIFLMLGVASIHLAGIAMQAKFFQYHYAATLPLVSFIVGLGLYKLWRRALGWRTIGVALFASSLVLLVSMRTAVRTNPGTFWQRSAMRLSFLLGLGPGREELDRRLYHVADYDLDADRRAAREVARLAPPGSSVFVWGFEPVIYWLSDRRPATSFIYNVAQRASWGRERARTELISELRMDPPEVVVVEHGDVFAHVTGDSMDSNEALATFPALYDLILSRYRYVRTVDKFDVYTRQDGRQGG